MRECIVKIERLDNVGKIENPVLQRAFVGQPQCALEIPNPLAAPHRADGLGRGELTCEPPDCVERQHERKLAHDGTNRGEPTRRLADNKEGEPARCAQQRQDDCVVGGKPGHRREDRGCHAEILAAIAAAIETDRVRYPAAGLRRDKIDVMHDDRTLVEARIRRAVEQRIVPAVHGPVVPFDVEIYEVPGEPISYDDAIAAQYSPFRLGSGWAKPWGTAWFKLRARVPDAWAGREIEAIIDIGFAPHSPGFQSEATILWR